MQDTKSTEGVNRTRGMSSAAITVCLCAAKPFMVVAEAAAVLRVSKSYLYTGLREGRFPGVLLGDRYKMPRDFVIGFIKAPAGTRFEDFAAEWLAREAQAVAS